MRPMDQWKILQTATEKMREMKLAGTAPATADKLKAAALASFEHHAKDAATPRMQLYLDELAEAVLAGKTYSERVPEFAARMIQRYRDMLDAATRWTPPPANQEGGVADVG